MPSTQDYEKQIDKLVNDIIRMSSLIQNIASPKEQEQMLGKKATFIIGQNLRYTLDVKPGGKVELSDNLDNVTTYVSCASPKVFLEIIDKIMDDGDSGAFQRAYQRGDLKIRGPHSLHDMIKWKEGLDKFIEVKKQYSFI